MYNSTWTAELHNTVLIVKRKCYTNKTNSTMVTWSVNLERRKVTSSTRDNDQTWFFKTPQLTLRFGTRKTFWLDQFRIHDIGSPAAKPSPWRQLLFGHWRRYRNPFRVLFAGLILICISSIKMMSKKWIEKNLILYF